MNWFWEKEEAKDSIAIEDLRQAIKSNKLTAIETIKTSRRSKNKSQELIKLGEQALDILEGVEKKK